MFASTSDIVAFVIFSLIAWALGVWGIHTYEIDKWLERFPPHIKKPILIFLYFPYIGFFLISVFIWLTIIIGLILTIVVCPILMLIGAITGHDFDL